MRRDVYMAGSGGQGVLLIGQLLTEAASQDGLQVSYFPVYSPEVRGGSTTCTVVMSDGAVGSPIVGRPSAMLLMDQFSVQNSLGSIREGGLVIANSSLVQGIARPGLRTVEVPATDMAREIGNERIANMVMLGAYVEVTGAVTEEALERALKIVVPERHHRYLPLNRQALEAGVRAAREFVSQNG